MLREIRFRAWCKATKRMVPIDGEDLYIADGKVYEVHEHHVGFESYTRKEDVTDRYVLMQYVEKEGFYEGDVVTGNDVDEYGGRRCHWHGLVCYDEKAGRIRILDWTEGWHETDDYGYDGVVGNIYEDPELQKHFEEALKDAQLPKM